MPKRRCPVETCAKAIGDQQLMCTEHWWAVPVDIRRRINRLYRPGQERDGGALPEYRAAVRQALAAVRGSA